MRIKLIPRRDLKLPAPTVGLFQAVGVTAYAWFIAFVMSSSQDWMPAIKYPAVIGAFMLLLFIVSALLSSSMVFAYPVLLFIRGEMQRAVRIVFWTAGWLVIIFLTFLLSVIVAAIK